MISFKEISFLDPILNFAIFEHELPLSNAKAKI
jgi:hypothetical protein